jgi:hypothetical protein
MRDIIKQLEVVGCIMTCPPLSCQRKRAAGPRRKGAHHAPEPTQGCTLSACEALRQARAPGLPVGWDAGRCAAAVRGRGLAGGAWPCFALCSLLGCGLWAAGPLQAPGQPQCPREPHSAPHEVPATGENEKRPQRDVLPAPSETGKTGSGLVSGVGSSPSWVVRGWWHVVGSLADVPKLPKAQGSPKPIATGHYPLANAIS